MSDELKPCPFCNGEGVIYEYSTVETCPRSMRPAQPAEAERVGIKKFEFEIGEGGPVTEPLVRYKDHLAALSAVTAERDRLLQEKGDPAGSFEKCMQAMRDRDEHAKTIDQLRAEVEALRKAPAGWAKMDPTFVVEHIRETTVFDADMIEAMLEFAIGAAMAAKEA